MTAAKLSEADFINLFETIGPVALAKQSNANFSGVMRRRRNLELKHGRRIAAPEATAHAPIVTHPERMHLEIKDGIVIIGSDGHYWPGEPSLAHRAFVHFIKELKPKAVIYNGDAFDGASVSRHPPIGWTSQPTVQDELETCQERLHEIALAAPRGCKRIFTMGNHDQRFETRLATAAPEYAKVHGTSLHDHFPAWTPCLSVFINDDRQGVVVKHRFKGGNFAPFNNTLWSGRSMVTGHLHSGKVLPISDYNGTRYGVDAGCLADVRAKAFGYSEDQPKNWTSGFCVLTFRDGRLLWPELVTVFDEKHVQFRGEIVKV